MTKKEVANQMVNQPEKGRKKTVTSYTVIYRTGGPERFRWHKALPVATREEALELQRRVERQGYKALIHDTASLEAIGLPETWE